MPFEYDPKKSIGNKAKHGIDFEEIQALWDDPERTEIPAKTVDEPRTLVIGKISGKVWSCIVTPRQDNIRIISARRARVEEVSIYENQST
ncbi:MAG: BrnT family toxin [Spirochaetes bacterium]|nr:BrnT family toxin [Spirochaetota bacterium]